MTDLIKQLSRTKPSAEQRPAVEPIRTVLGSLAHGVVAIK